MQRKTEGLGQIYTRVMLCGQDIGPDYDKHKQTIICQLKPIISIRLQLQVNTCRTLGACWSISEDGTCFWESSFQTDIQLNCNFWTAIYSAIVISTLFALIVVSSRWPRGNLVGYISMSHHHLPTSFPQLLSHSLLNCLVKKVNHGTDVFTHKHTASYYMCSQARTYEINYIDRQ